MSTTTDSSTGRARLDSVDLMRGIVMVIMALDHVRHALSNAQCDPTAFECTTPTLFATRWITHFCAPAFCFLAGTGAFLSRKPPKQLSWFLLTRGLWLLILELTVVHVGFFGPQYHFIPLITLWALGWAMITLGALLLLPQSAIAVFVAIVIVGHNALDGVHGGAFWHFLHEPGVILDRPARKVFIGYPIIPWIAVMAAGYLFGNVMTMPPERRRRVLTWIGTGALLSFAVLRLVNHYGDRQAWTAQKNALFTFLAFINVTKYPPSLDFLLVTLGPMFLGLVALDGVRVQRNNPFLVFGRVPLFYYVLHLYAIILARIATFYPRYGNQLFSFNERNRPDDFGVGLPGVFLVWIVVVAALYPACRWYAGVKQRNRSPWLSYL